MLVCSERRLQALEVLDGDGQLGVAQAARWLEARHGLGEVDPQTALSIGGEGEAAVGDREARRAAGLEERVWPRDLGAGDVGERRLQAPRPEARDEPVFIDFNPRPLGRDAEWQRRRSIPRRPEEKKTLGGYVQSGPKSGGRETIGFSRSASRARAAMPLGVRPQCSMQASPVPEIPNSSPMPTAKIGTGWRSAATSRTASARPPTTRCSSAVTATPVFEIDSRIASEWIGLMIETLSTSASTPSSRSSDSAASSARQTMWPVAIREMSLPSRSTSTPSPSDSGICS